ncbi:hypothetical protein AJ78_01120 [Emergomyces pasteurianus Ep9510]|uniref:DUF7918 domain-containing protein n=1 Tax=Emergomyces pasteurianus Ep9510 TaxID=1447872 RepID=A0A1J9PR18_9EURO|nr:hypothetical protein AJ78_01120 [Emergomyces pasteurianus Ep9510]
MVTMNNLVMASVLIDGKPAQEYSTGECDETHSFTRYIESKAGFEYCIQIVAASDFIHANSIACELTIDGQKECRLLRLNKDGHDLVYVWDGAQFIENDRPLKKPYNFAEVTPSETSSISAPNPEVGTIRVEIWRAEHDQTKGHELEWPTPFKPITDISDKVTKWSGINQVTSLGVGKEIDMGEYGLHLPIRKIDQNPLIAAEFLYRSGEGLIELGVTSPPDPLAVPQNERAEEECLANERLQSMRQNLFRSAVEMSPKGGVITLPLHTKPVEARNSSERITSCSNRLDQ